MLKRQLKHNPCISMLCLRQIYKRVSFAVKRVGWTQQKKMQFFQSGKNYVNSSPKNRIQLG